jgi:nitric oxide dioxygenase
MCITEEAALYEHSKNKHGGWAGTRQFEITYKQVESALVTSFTLTPIDGKAVITHKPGQYLGVKVKPAGAEYEEIRQYSISQKANGKNYRISVKKELQPKPGMVSNYLHSLAQGDVVELYTPAGDFFLRNSKNPVVLISAGVGQTPMLAMLETLLSDNSKQNIMYLHASENTQQHSFAHYLNELSTAYNSLQTITWFNQSSEGADFTGLMDLTAIKTQLPLTNGDFYLCGPAGFMAFVKSQLLALGVKNEHIHYEVFGPHQDL